MWNMKSSSVFELWLQKTAMTQNAVYDQNAELGMCILGYLFLLSIILVQNFIFFSYYVIISTKPAFYDPRDDGPSSFDMSCIAP